MITIELPRALQPHAQGSAALVLDRRFATVGEALASLADRYPGVLDRIIDERGEVRPHVNVFVGPESIRFLGGLRAPLPEGSTVTIVPAVSGG
jgi:molybdopterin synthase sulfur carrier subunit